MTDIQVIGYLNRSGLVVSKYDYIKKYSRTKYKEILSKFEFTTILYRGDICRHKIYTIDNINRTIIFPRIKGLQYVSPYLDSVVNNISPGVDLKLLGDKWNYTFELYPNQKIVFDYLLKTIYSDEKCNAGYSSTVLNMKPGLGKTYISIALMSKLKQKTLVVVHTISLLVQWRGLLEKYLPQLKIGTYYTEEKKDGDIIIITCKSVLSENFKFISGKYKNKIVNKLTSNNFFKLFGLVIYDEVHKYCAPERRKIFNKLQTPYVLGMSGTAHRLDKLDKVFKYFLGDITYVDKIEGYHTDEIKFNVNVDMIKYKGPSKYTRSLVSEGTGTISAPLMINQICTDPYRKKLLCLELEKIYKKKENTFIFADRRDYLTELATMLVKSLDKYKNEDEKNVTHIKINDQDFSVLLGGSNESDINNAKINSSMIFSTYAFLDTGISITKMTNLVIATPRKNGWEQIVGRILRMGSDINKTRYITILCDYNTAIKKQTMYAKNQIKKLFNAKCKIRTIDWTDLC